jgi:protein-tyrosine phosphatase
MVCLGNICRSPMAAAVAAAMGDEAGLAGRVEVESFGTAGYHRGEAADARADAALRRRGWPAGGHRARQIRAADVVAADLVLCADRANRAAVRRLAPEHAGKVQLLRAFDPSSGPDDEVPDPWDGDDGDFDHALALIEDACRGLVAELAAEGR